MGYPKRDPLPSVSFQVVDLQRVVKSHAARGPKGPAAFRQTAGIRKKKMCSLEKSGLDRHLVCHFSAGKVLQFTEKSVPLWATFSVMVAGY